MIHINYNTLRRIVLVSKSVRATSSVRNLYQRRYCKELEDGLDDNEATLMAYSLEHSQRRSMLIFKIHILFREYLILIKQLFSWSYACDLIMQTKNLWNEWQSNRKTAGYVLIWRRNCFRQRNLMRISIYLWKSQLSNVIRR